MDLPSLLANYRKGIVAIVGTGAMTALAYLGPTWSVAVLAALSAAAVIVIPNADTDGDGKVSIEEAVDFTARLAVDAAVKAHPAIPYPATGEPVTEAITLQPIPAT